MIFVIGLYISKFFYTTNDTYCLARCFMYKPKKLDALI